MRDQKRCSAAEKNQKKTAQIVNVLKHSLLLQSTTKAHGGELNSTRPVLVNGRRVNDRGRRQQWSSSSVDAVNKVKSAKTEDRTEQKAESRHFSATVNVCLLQKCSLTHSVQH